METIERNDLTTPSGISAELERLQKMIGTPGAATWIHLSADNATHISVYANWCRSTYGDDVKIGYIEGATFAELTANAEQAIHNWKATRHNDVIRKMALAVISITDEHTECTATRLKAAGFSESDITTYHEKACARASEMAGAAPFKVLF
jgi:hypothetical protein